jgi:hypothetical protein
MTSCLRKSRGDKLSRIPGDRDRPKAERQVSGGSKRMRTFDGQPTSTIRPKATDRLRRARRRAYRAAAACRRRLADPGTAQSAANTAPRSSRLLIAGANTAAAIRNGNLRLSVLDVSFSYGAVHHAFELPSVAFLASPREWHLARVRARLPRRMPRRQFWRLTGRISK